MEGQIKITGHRAASLALENAKALRVPAPLKCPGSLGFEAADHLSLQLTVEPAIPRN